MQRKTTTATPKVPISSEDPRAQKNARCHRRGTRPAVSVALTVRQQTPEEEGRFQAALHLFLSEVVRQHLGREGGDNG